MPHPSIPGRDWYQELIMEHQPFTFLFTRAWPDGIDGRLRNTEMDLSTIGALMLTGSRLPREA